MRVKSFNKKTKRQKITIKKKKSRRVENKKIKERKKVR